MFFDSIIATAMTAAGAGITGLLIGVMTILMGLN